MRILTLTIVLMLTTAICAIAADGERPVALVFPTAKGEGADKQLADSTTKAIRNYLRNSERVDATVFDPESATVLRAIMEKKLTPDQVASYSSRSERLEVAKTLAFDYAAGSEVAVRNGSVEVKLWLARVGGGKHSEWESTGSATAVGTAARDLDNSMQSAASSAVLEVSRKALENLPAIKEADPSSGNETLALTNDTSVSSPTSFGSGYASEAEKNVAAGNLAVAIDLYSKAISAEPDNANLRIELAEVYARKGLFSEADDELQRAIAAGAEAQVASAARDTIDAIRSGNAPTPEVKPRPPMPDAPETTTDSRAVVSKPKQVEPAVAKIIEGDKLWSGGNPDEAAAAYKASIAIDPTDWRSHERLVAVTASMSLFGESLTALQQLKTVQPEPTAKTVATRYSMLTKIFDGQFNKLVKQYEDGWQAFQREVTTRERFYNDVNGLAIRLEAMAKFVDGLQAPAVNEPANLRRGLACGLVAQAASSLLSYLESDDETAKSNADVFVAQAKKELQTAATLDANKIVVTQ